MQNTRRGAPVSVLPRDPNVTLRELSTEDAAELTAMNVRNRADIERVSPPQTEATFTAEGQARRIGEILAQTAQGTRAYWTIRVGGALAGDISLHAMQRGAVQTANVGYMVDAASRGRGVATAALRLVVAKAFGELGLHRLDAGAMPSNIGSQRVLEKAGFTRVGVLERFLYVGHAWEDHVTYEIVGADFVPDVSS